jgi:hypothetical protein
LQSAYGERLRMTIVPEFAREIKGVSRLQMLEQVLFA